MDKMKIRAALEIIGNTPKTLYELGKLGVQRKFLNKLIELDVITKRFEIRNKCRMNIYSLNENGRRYLMQREPIKTLPVAQPRTISVMEGVYKPAPWNVRDGGEDHKQYSRRGF